MGDVIDFLAHYKKAKKETAGQTVIPPQPELVVPPVLDDQFTDAAELLKRLYDPYEGLDASIAVRLVGISPDIWEPWFRY